jgi:diguanylate cyclase (GGDEF)-like protein
MATTPSDLDVCAEVARASHGDAFVLDADDVIAWARGRSVRAAHRQGRELVGQSVHELVSAEDQERAVALLGAARTTGALLIDTLHTAEGRAVEVALHDLGHLGLLVESWDVTIRDARERDLRERSLHDPLTRVANRSLLLDRLQVALSPRRAGAKPVGALFVDIDGFKRVNDRWGHAVGDEVLVRSAARMSSVLRPADTVGRLGGDEFAIVCGDVAGPEDLRRVGERVLEVLHQPIEVHGVQVPMRASVGGALCLDGSVDAAQLLAAADAAMYDAKTSGGGALRLRLVAREAEVALP